MRRLVAAIAGGALVLAMCSRRSELPVRTTSGSPAPVTLRFVNGTAYDVFVNVTAGDAFEVADRAGRPLERGHFCHGSCGRDCQCMQCGSPLMTVRKIPRGGVFETAWTGDFYENGQCGKGCGCDEARMAEDGAYGVTLRGRTGAKSSGAVIGGDPNVTDGVLDPASQECVASGNVVLGAKGSTADIAWSCGP